MERSRRVVNLTPPIRRRTYAGNRRRLCCSRVVSGLVAGGFWSAISQADLEIAP